MCAVGSFKILRSLAPEPARHSLWLYIALLLAVHVLV